ncbi:MAG: SDR family oxidoreductase [Deltaproteobacteria bacterium]|nr:SDR family oxidoreductase [Deltaproteobacteria bacterium]
MDLNGKTAVVTGSAGGIGFAMAELFASKGATSIITDIPAAPIDEAVKKIIDNGGKAIGIPCDVSKEDNVEALMQKVVEETGRLDVAVLNAGILRDGVLVKADRETKKVVKKMTLEQWQAIINVNLTGVFLTGREAAVQMINCGNGGVIIPMSSIARHGNMGQTNYSAAKAGVSAMTVVWSKELAKYKIRAAAIAPGFIGTPMVMKDMKPEALEKWKKIIPIGRMGEPEEMAHTALYIIENGMITGITIDASGGVRI